MSDQAQETKQESSTPWYETAGAAGVGAALGTVLLPGLGTLAGAALGAGADALYHGLFDSKPTAAPKPGEAAKPAEAPKAEAPAAAAPAASAKPGAPTAEETAATKKIDGGYNDKKGYNPNEKLGDLSKMSPEEKLKALSKLTQNDPKDPASKDMCGPTALIAAAMYSGGNEGIAKLLATLKDSNGEGSDSQKDIARLQAKLADAKSGGLDMKDLHGLEKDLYQRLQSDQYKMGDANQGIGNETLQKFINGNKLGGMFYDKDGKQIMNMNLIANEMNKDGTAIGPKHWVLDINDPKAGATSKAQDGRDYNAVFDPFARNAGQVTTSANKDLFKAYNTTQAWPTPMQIQNN